MINFWLSCILLNFTFLLQDGKPRIREIVISVVLAPIVALIVYAYWIRFLYLLYKDFIYSRGKDVSN